MLSAPCALSTEPRPDTVSAFNHYVCVAEAQMEEGLHNGKFFHVDGLGAAERQQIYAKLRQGELYIQQVHVLDNGKRIEIPGGLITHWLGMEFIPGGTLAQTEALFQDFEHQNEIYKPDVVWAKLISRQGNQFKTYVRLYQKAIITVVMDVYFDASIDDLGSGRAESKSHSTRIDEVVNAGAPDESKLPEEKSNGYLWRLYSYWRIEEKDGGVYVQSESIALSRTVPWEYAWLVKPLLKDIPRKRFSAALLNTRRAITDKDYSQHPAGNISAYGTGHPPSTPQ